MKKGGVTLAVLAVLLVVSAPAHAFSVAVNAEGGTTPDLVAGSHPDSIVTTVDFPLPGTEGDVRDIHLELPPGLIENPSAVSKCSQVEFHKPRVSQFESSLSGESCGPLSQIGVVEVRSAAGVRTFRLFNLDPPPGTPSQIGFSPNGKPLTLTPRIRELGGEYGATLDLRDLPQELELTGLTITVWGTPWAIQHNGRRGECLNEAEPEVPFAKCPVEPNVRAHFPYAYLTLPASCTGPIAFTLSADTWQSPALANVTDVSRDAFGVPAGLQGCAGLGFEPRATAGPTNPRASSPSGFDFDLTPKEEEALINPRREVPAQARKAVVTLPEGMTLNPSLAAGLGVCSPAGYAAETAASAAGAGCPETSKIGSFTVESQLFINPVKGNVYLAQPDDPASLAPGAE